MNSAIKKCWIILTVGMAAFLPAFNQDLKISNRTARFEKLGSNEGLKPGFISNVVRDTTGFLWIGTSINIQRYDGYNFIPITAFIDSSNYKPQNSWIQFIDCNNNLWIKDDDSSYQIFHQASGRMINPMLPMGVSITPDSTGNYWCQYRNEWYYLPLDAFPEDPDSLQNFDFLKKWESAFTTFKGFIQHPGDSYLNFQGKTISWVKDNRLHCYDIDSESRLAETKLDIQFSKDQDLLQGTTRIFINYKKSKLYIVSTQSIIVIDIIKKTVESVLKIPSSIERIWPELMDINGRIWMASSSHGIIWIDPEKAKLEILSNVNSKFDGDAPLKYSRRFKMDKDNIIWIPTGSYGLYKYRLDTEKFRIARDSVVPLSMPNLIPHPTNGIVFESGPTFHFDPEKNEYKQIYNVLKLLPENTKVNHIALKLDDHGNYIYNGSTEAGRFYFNTDSLGNLTHQAYTDSHPDWFLDNYICHAGKKYWRYNGLFSVQLLNELHKIQESYDFPGTLPDKPVFNHSTNLDKFYFGFQSGKIIEFDTVSYSFKSYQLLNRHQKIERTLRVNTIHKDVGAKYAYLWVGTNDGLYRIDQLNDEVVRYDEDDGLSDNYIYGMLSDKYHKLWISTNNGLIQMSSEGEVIRIFRDRDGIQDNEFNSGSFAKGNDGYLYFGGVGGLTYFRPEDFNEASSSSKTVISSYSIGETVYPINTQSQYSNTLIKPKIKYKSDLFGVSFANLDLNNPQINKYQLELHNHDLVSLDIGSKNTIDLLLLDPGEYTMEVRGRNSYTKWSNEPAKFSFIVNTPWYLTNWFRLLAVFLICIIVLSVVLYRRTQIRNIQALRSRIARDLHDEIGSTLSGISLFGTVALKSTDDQSKLRRLLEQINNSAISATESINDIIWTINSSNDKVSQLANRIRAYASEISESGKWEINLYVDEKILDTDISMVHRRNFYMVYKEAVNNAIKYSEGSVIIVRFEKIHNDFRLEVKDNGKGFDPDNPLNGNKMGGNGLINMKRRANEMQGNLVIDSKPGIGTRVVLTCPV